MSNLHSFTNSFTAASAADVTAAAIEASPGAAAVTENSEIAEASRDLAVAAFNAHQRVAAANHFHEFRFGSALANFARDHEGDQAERSKCKDRHHNQIYIKHERNSELRMLGASFNLRFTAR